mgnify:CR=1 FL=1
MARRAKTHVKAAPAAKGPTRKEVLAKRNEQIIESWANNPHVPATMAEFGLERAVITTILRKARKAGDARVPNLKDPFMDDAVRDEIERKQEMARALYQAADVVRLHREGYEVEAIAKMTHLKPREVRAAIYQAIQSGTAGGAYAKKDEEPGSSR